MSAPIAAAMVAVTIATGVPTMTASAELIKKHEAQGFADSAALAAADALFGFVEGEPCLVAEKLGSFAKKVVSSCNIEGTTVTVIVSYGMFRSHAVARAGANLNL